MANRKSRKVKNRVIVRRSKGTLYQAEDDDLRIGKDFDDDGLGFIVVSNIEAQFVGKFKSATGFPTTHVLAENGKTYEVFSDWSANEAV